MATTILQQTGEWTEGGIPSASTSTSVTPDGQPVDDHKCTASSRTESDSPVETTDNAAANFSTKSSERLSSGEVAGVAIGCLVAGLVLGISAMFLLFRRRRGRNHAAINPSQTTKPDIEQKDGIQVSVTPSKNDVELSQFLLESTPDKEIEGELRSLSELIYQHVENHYHQSEVVGNSETLAQSLVDMGYSPEASRMEAEAVVAKCIAPKTRQVGLRHVLSHAIFRSLDFSSRSSLSILPPPVNALLEASLLVEGANSSAISLALSRRRSLSALLLHPTPNERTPLPVSTAEVSPRAKSLANELNTFLHLFIAQDSASRQEQKSHLQAVIMECVKLGYTILSQPSDWRFVFSDSITMNQRIVVCPGLERLSHKDGTRYRSPKEVVAPRTTLL